MAGRDILALTEFNKELREEIVDGLDLPREEGMIASSMAIIFGSDRLTTAEIFDDFIPGSVAGIGKRQRRFRVDGYQIDSADNSVHLVITDFDPSVENQTLTSTQATALFKQIEHFVDVCIDNSIWERETSMLEQVELSKYLSNQLSEVSRFRLHLFTNRVVSNRLQLESMKIANIETDTIVWDLERMCSLASSRIGSDEFVVDFTKFSEKGLPCIKANETEDYEGYLAVIDGATLAGIYDLYGSRILEGNVRAYLSARGKVNKGIQATISKEPEKFFAFNNGVSCTATEVEIVDTPQGSFIKSAKYLQIVNGGQTTASIFIASMARNTGFNATAELSVQMKLSVIKPENSEALEDLIYHIARYSNTQNTVKESDFFSNHEFHRLFENKAQSEWAPPIVGETTNQTHWFYERARGAYDAKQMVLTASERKQFQKSYPRAQRLEKTDLAKFIHAWAQRPHDVCDSGQRNFKKFADNIISDWGQQKSRYHSPDYFKETIAKAILYKRMSKIVDKAPWYPKGSGYRQGIVSYSISLLSLLIQRQGEGGGLNFKRVWQDQRLSPVLEEELYKIGEHTTQIISAPALDTVSLQGLQWFKNEGCWKKLQDISDFKLSKVFLKELISANELLNSQREQLQTGKISEEIDDTALIMQLGAAGWLRMIEWCQISDNPRFGMEAELMQKMTIAKFFPSPKQVKILAVIAKASVAAGFTLDPS